jgi:hypothetical protein
LRRRRTQCEATEAFHAERSSRGSLAFELEFTLAAANANAVRFEHGTAPGRTTGSPSSSVAVAFTSFSSRIGRYAYLRRGRYGRQAPPCPQKPPPRAVERRTHGPGPAPEQDLGTATGAPPSDPDGVARTLAAGSPSPCHGCRMGAVPE